MGDRKFILFELHMDGDLQVGPESISTGGPGGLTGTGGSDEAAADDEGGESHDGGPGRALPVGLGTAVVALAVLLGLGVLVRRLLGGGSDDADFEDDVEVAG